MCPFQWDQNKAMSMKWELFASPLMFESYHNIKTKKNFRIFTYFIGSFFIHLFLALMSSRNFDFSWMVYYSIFSEVACCNTINCFYSREVFPAKLQFSYFHTFDWDYLVRDKFQYSPPLSPRTKQSKVNNDVYTKTFKKLDSNAFAYNHIRLQEMVFMFFVPGVRLAW